MYWYIFILKLEQLQRLGSEIYPRHPMITHTSDSHQIPSQKNTKSKLVKKIAKNSNFELLQKNVHARHVLKWLIRYINMNWIRPELYVLQIGHGMRDGRKDGWTEGRMDLV